MIGTHSEDTDDGSSHFGNLFYHKLVLETAEETDQIANICWIMEKAREFQKNIYFLGFNGENKMLQNVCFAITSWSDLHRYNLTCTDVYLIVIVILSV